MVKKVVGDNFDEIKSSKIAVADFSATWCGPCKMIAPIVEEIAQEREDIAVGKINVDQDPELARHFGVMSIPTVVFLKGGREIARKVGVMPPEAFTQVLDANK